MNEFLTWFIVSALEVTSVSLLACLVTLFLDRFGAPDDKVNFIKQEKKRYGRRDH